MIVLAALLAGAAPIDCRAYRDAVAYALRAEPGIVRQGATVELSPESVPHYDMPYQPLPGACASAWKIEGKTRGLRIVREKGRVFLRVAKDVAPGTQVRIAAKVAGHRASAVFTVHGAAEPLLSGSFFVARQEHCRERAPSGFEFSADGAYLYRYDFLDPERNVARDGNGDPMSGVSRGRYRWDPGSGAIAFGADRLPFEPLASGVARLDGDTLTIEGVEFGGAPAAADADAPCRYALRKQSG